MIGILGGRFLFGPILILFEGRKNADDILLCPRFRCSVIAFVFKFNRSVKEKKEKGLYRSDFRVDDSPVRYRRRMPAREEHRNEASSEPSHLWFSSFHLCWLKGTATPAIPDLHLCPSYQFFIQSFRVPSWDYGRGTQPARLIDQPYVAPEFSGSSFVHDLDGRARRTELLELLNLGIQCLFGQSFYVPFKFHYLFLSLIKFPIPLRRSLYPFPMFQLFLFECQLFANGDIE